MSWCMHACAGSWQDEDVCHIPGPTGSFASTFLIGLVIFSFVDPWSVNCKGATILLRDADEAQAHSALHLMMTYTPTKRVSTLLPVAMLTSPDSILSSKLLPEPVLAPSLLGEAPLLLVLGPEPLDEEPRTSSPLLFLFC